MINVISDQLLLGFSSTAERPGSLSSRASFETHCKHVNVRPSNSKEAECGRARSVPALTSHPARISLPPVASLCFLWQLQVRRGSGVKTAAGAPLVFIPAHVHGSVCRRGYSKRVCVLSYFRHIRHTRIFLALKGSVCTSVRTSVGICAQHGVCVLVCG